MRPRRRPVAGVAALSIAIASASAIGGLGACAAVVGFPDRELGDGDAGPGEASTTRPDPAVQLAHLQTAGKMLSAQYLDGYAADPEDTLELLASQGAPTPAAIGVPRIGDGVMNTKLDTSLYYLTLANEHLTAGNLVMISSWAGNPKDFDDGGQWMCPGPSSQPDAGGEDLAGTDLGTMSAADFTDLTNPGTPIGAAWRSTLDLWATDLASLDGTVLFRAFHEMNGANGLWWQDQSPAAFIALWKYTHDYLNVTKGLASKLRWVWAINAGEGHYETYYPADDYVDVCALDAFSPDATIYTGQIDGYGLEKSPMGSLFSHGKPVIIAETSSCNGSGQAPAGTCDYTQLLAALKSGAAATALPLPAATFFYFTSDALDQQNDAGKSTAYLGDSVIVNLPGLPAYD